MAASPNAQRDLTQAFARFRPRLLVALIIGVTAATVVPGETWMRAVVGWDSGAFCYLTLIAVMAARATPQSMARRAQYEDASRWVFLTVMAAAAWFSMFALLRMLNGAHGQDGHLAVEQAVFAGATILLSWLFAHTAFAVHYAHDYYADLAAKRPAGLLFPGKEREPDYWDFLYFSFVIGMTGQVSDVQVASRVWRRLVLVHGGVAFVFNTVILALSVNILAGQL